MTHAARYLREVAEIVAALDEKPLALEQLAREVAMLARRGGRLFIAGLGGSAANASHAANDFRKLARLDAICLSDNVAELTARANDEGWATVYAKALAASRAGAADALLVLSVGGGTSKVSLPLVSAVDEALKRGMRVLGVVGPHGGHAARRGHAVVRIPAPEARVTPHTEAFQAVVLHYLVSHPAIQKRRTKW